MDLSKLSTDQLHTLKSAGGDFSRLDGATFRDMATAMYAPTVAPEVQGPFGAGVDYMQGDIQTGLAGLTDRMGLEGASASLMEAAAANRASGETYQPEVSDYRQIDELSDVPKYLYHQLAFNAPSLLATAGAGLAGGAIGGPLGAYAGASAINVPSMFGSNIRAQMEAQGTENIADVDLTKAGGTAVLQGLLEGGFARFLPGIGKAATTNAISKMLKGGSTKFWRNVAEAATFEGVTEAGQQALEILQADPSKLASMDEDVVAELLNAAIGGALLGGIAGGPLGFVQAKGDAAAEAMAERNKQQLEETERSERETFVADLMRRGDALDTAKADRVGPWGLRPLPSTERPVPTDPDADEWVPNQPLRAEARAKGWFAIGENDGLVQAGPFPTREGVNRYADTALTEATRQAVKKDFNNALDRLDMAGARAHLDLLMSSWPGDAISHTRMQERLTKAKADLDGAVSLIDKQIAATKKVLKKAGAEAKKPLQRRLQALQTIRADRLEALKNVPAKKIKTPHDPLETPTGDEAVPPTEPFYIQKEMPVPGGKKDRVFVDRKIPTKARDKDGAVKYKDRTEKTSYATADEAEAAIAKLQVASPEHVFSAREEKGETQYAVIEQSKDKAGTVVKEKQVERHGTLGEAEQAARLRNGLPPLDYTPGSLGEMAYKAVREKLDKWGFKDIPLKIQDVIQTAVSGVSADGIMTIEDGQATIKLALLINKDMTDAQIVEHLESIGIHELFHAIEANGLLTATEFSTLAETAARVMKPEYKTLSFQEAAEIQYEGAYTISELMETEGAEIRARLEKRGGDPTNNDELNEEAARFRERIIQEEAIAELLRAWAANPDVIPAVVPKAAKAKSLFKRIMDFFRGISEIKDLKEEDINADVRGVLASIAGGEVAARPIAPVWTGTARARPSAVALQHRALDVAGTGPGGRVRNWDLATALTDRHMAKHGRVLNPSKQADFELVVSDLMEEFTYQNSQLDSGQDWYVEDINRAIEATIPLIPELADPQKRMLFLMMAASTSPQQKPNENWSNAIIGMQGYLKNGVIATTKENGAGFGVKSHTTGLQLIQHLIDSQGERAAIKWLTSAHTGADIAKMRLAAGLFEPGLKKNGVISDQYQDYLASETNLTEIYLGAYMLGPKVGDFLLNATGFDPNAVTVDLWAARTYNRLIGRLTDVSAAEAEEGKIASDVRGVGERKLIKALVAEAARRAGITPSAMQAMLWFFEQRLYRTHDIPAQSQSFSGAALLAVPQPAPITGPTPVAPRSGKGHNIAGLDPRDAGDVRGSVRQDARGLRPGHRRAGIKQDPFSGHSRERASGVPATFNDFSKGNIADILDKDGWSILTAENAGAESMSQAENAIRTAKLLSTLNSAGIPYKRVTGRYGGEYDEKSVLILADEEMAKALGKEFGQDSVLTRDGLVYGDGRITPATGVTVHDQAPDNFFSVIDDTGVTFTVDLDFDGEYNPADGEVQDEPAALKSAKTRTSAFDPQIIEAAVKRFGTTTDPKKAGYIMYDGKMLDFSEGTDTRTLNHNAVEEVFTPTSRDTITNFQNKTGALRAQLGFDPIMQERTGKSDSFITASITPSREQLRAVARFISETGEPVMLEAKDRSGFAKGSTTITSPSTTLMNQFFTDKLGPRERLSGFDMNSMPTDARFMIKAPNGKGTFGKVKVNGETYAVVLLRGAQSKVSDRGFGLTHIVKKHGEDILETSDYKKITDILADGVGGLRDKAATGIEETPDRIRFQYKAPRMKVAYQFVMGKEISGKLFPITIYPDDPDTGARELARKTERARKNMEAFRKEMASGRQRLSAMPTIEATTARIFAERKIEPNPWDRFMNWAFGYDIQGNETRTEAFLRATVHNMIGAFALDKDVAIAMGGGMPLSNGAAGKMLELATQYAGRVFALVNLGTFTYDPVTGDIKMKEASTFLAQIFAHIGPERQKEWGTYAIARREQDLRELLKDGKRTGGINGRYMAKLSDDDIKNIIAEAPLEFEQAFLDYQKFNADIVQFAVDTGYISEAFKDKLLEAAYIPYYRVFEGEDGTGDYHTAGAARLMNSLNNPASFKQKLEGGRQGVEPEVFNMIMKNTVGILRSSLANAALTRVAVNIEALNNTTGGRAATGDRWGRRINSEKDAHGAQIMRFRRNGVDEMWKIEDSSLWFSLVALSPAQQGALMKGLAYFSNILRQGVTHFPGFMLANIWRGHFEAYAKGGVPLTSLFTTFKNVRRILRNDPAAIALKVQTGMGGYDFGQSTQDYTKYLERVLRKSRRKDGADYDYMTNAMDGVKTFWSGLTKFGEATEMAQRLTVMENMMAVNPAIGEKEAAYQAMNIINYARKGTGQGALGMSTAFLIPLIPFLNARLQGLYRLAEHQGALNPEKQRQQAVGINTDMLMKGAVLTGITALVYGIMSQDDRWDEERLDRKLGNDILYIGDLTIYLPRAFEIGSIFGSIPVLIGDALLKEDGGKDVLPGIMHLISSTFAINPIPQAAKPIMEVLMNYDMFFQRPIEGAVYQTMRPEDRFNSYTSALARGMGSMLGMSPIKIDKLINGYTGSGGMALLSVVDAAAQAAGVFPEKPDGLFGGPYLNAGAGDVIGLSRFFKADDERSIRFISDFYQMKQEMLETYTSMRSAIERGEIERAQSLMEDNRTLLGLRRSFNRTAESFTALNRQIRMIEQGELDGTAKRNALAPLRRRKMEMARRMVQMGNKAGI